MYPFSRSIRKLAIFFVAVALAVVPGRALAAAITAQESGRYNATGTWTGGVVPGAADTVTITGHHVYVMTTGKAASSITLAVGGAITLGDGVTPISFALGGGGVGLPSFNCTDGALVMTGNSTLTIDPDDAMTTRLDGLTLQSNSCTPMLRGRLLYSGEVDSVTFDDPTNETVIIDAGLAEMQQDFPAEAVLVWRESDTPRPTDKVGRWYDLICSGTCISATNSLTLDFDSRSNDKRKGATDLTGTSSVSGTTVTYATGSTWAKQLTLGGLWWCDSDGIGSAERIRRFVNSTTLELDVAYGGAGCGTAAAATIREDNAPWPRDDVDEYTVAGDRYDVILPATVKSLNASDSVFTEQIFVDIEEGNTGVLQYVSFQGVGHHDMPITTGQKQQGSGLYWNTPTADAITDTIEITLFGGLAASLYKDATKVIYEKSFIHWSHPLNTSNHGHGILFVDTADAPVASCVKVRHNRVERINDDMYFMSGIHNGCADGSPSRVHDNIAKYVPTTAAGDTCDGVDTGNGTASTGNPSSITSGSGGALMIDRNFFSNIGCTGSGSFAYAFNTFPEAFLPWSLYVVRDNFFFNSQLGFGGGAAAAGGNRNFGLQTTVWFLNNYFSHLDASAGRDTPNLYQNIIVNTGADHSPFGCARNTYNTRSNICVSTPWDRTGDSLASGFNVVAIAGEGDHAGTHPVLTDNAIFADGKAIDIGEWTKAGAVGTGGIEIHHNAILPHPLTKDTTSNRTAIDCTTTTETTDSLDPVVQNNVISTPGSGGGRNMFCSNACLAPIIRSNAYGSGGGSFGTSFFSCGAEGGSNINNLQVAGSSGWLDARGSAVSGAGGVTTTDGDLPGPRFAGMLWYRMKWDKPHDLPPNVVQGTNAKDSDGDGLIDLWDNCDLVSNPGWLDTDGNGVGDACQ